MTRKQTKIVQELKAAFADADIQVVDSSDVGGSVSVFMSIAPTSCRGDYLANHFVVGRRGGLKVLKQQFQPSK
jgi:hypothetical protein